ncbi:OLM2B protein, partial [Polyodon spathula]|nr:OLM2B protein [Polyodon spathula]
QLLGDYDKVKAVSEGSDCQCKCVVRPLSRTACKRVEEGSAKVNDFYTVETITSGPGCKCACIAPPSALNPCEGDFRFKKLQEAEKDGIKLSTVIELLEGAFYGLDLLKMHSVTTKLVHRMETLEKVALQNGTEKKEHLKGNTKVNHIPKKENSSTTSPIETKKQLTDLGSDLQRDAAAAYSDKEKYEARFVGEAIFSKPSVKKNEGVRLEPTTELLERLESSQTKPRTKPVSRPAIIRGVTYYKANPIDEDSETDEQQDDFPSGDGAIDLLIEEDQLIKHVGTVVRTVEVPEPMARPLTTVAPELDTQDNMETTQALTTTATAMESTATPSITTELPSTYITTTTATTTASSTPSTGTTTIMSVPPTSTSTPVQDTTSAATTAASTIPEPSTSKVAPITTARPTTAKTTTSIASRLLNTTSPPQLTITRQRVNINGDESQENMGDEAQPSPGYWTATWPLTKNIAWFRYFKFSIFKNNPINIFLTFLAGVCKDTLSTISDPVIHNTYGRNEGAWMKDPKSKEDKIYVTNYYYGNTLVEFRTMENFKQGRWTNSYKLPYNWIGTGHVVYDGAFYYNRAFSRDIIKYDLKQRYVAAWAMLHDAVFEETTPLKWKGHSDIDFAVDETGLWIIYPAIELIVLSKLNTADLTIQKETTWRTGLRKDFYGNCFIVCGVLYAADSYSQMNATISYAFDTHTNTQGVPRLPFVNNFSYTTQIDYNPKERVLYAWDRGHQVTYGVVFAY